MPYTFYGTDAWILGSAYLHRHRLESNLRQQSGKTSINTELPGNWISKLSSGGRLSADYSAFVAIYETGNAQVTGNVTYEVSFVHVLTFYLRVLFLIHTILPSWVYIHRLWFTMYRHSFRNHVASGRSESLSSAAARQTFVRQMRSTECGIISDEFEVPERKCIRPWRYL